MPEEEIMMTAEEWGEYNQAREAYDAWRKRRDKAKAACEESFKERWAIKLDEEIGRVQLTDRSHDQLVRYMESK